MNIKQKNQTSDASMFKNNQIELDNYSLNNNCLKNLNINNNNNILNINKDYYNNSNDLLSLNNIDQNNNKSSSKYDVFNF